MIDIVIIAIGFARLVGPDWVHLDFERPFDAYFNRDDLFDERLRKNTLSLGDGLERALDGVGSRSLDAADALNRVFKSLIHLKL